MDWITAAVEIAGLIILIIWTIIPIQEFKLIFRRLREERGSGGTRPDRGPGEDGA